MAILNDAYQLIAGGGLVTTVAIGENTQTVTVGKKYLLLANTDCFVRFSGSAVVGTDGNFDLFLPAGTIVVMVAINATLRVIRDIGDGVLGISEVEKP